MDHRTEPLHFRQTVLRWSMVVPGSSTCALHTAQPGQKAHLNYKDDGMLQLCQAAVVSMFERVEILCIGNI